MLSYEAAWELQRAVLEFQTGYQVREFGSKTDSMRPIIPTSGNVRLRFGFVAVAKGCRTFSFGLQSVTARISTVTTGRAARRTGTILTMQGASLWMGLSMGRRHYIAGGNCAFDHIYSTNLGELLDTPHGDYTHAKARHTGNAWVRHAGAGDDGSMRRLRRV